MAIVLDTSTDFILFGDDPINKKRIFTRSESEGYIIGTEIIDLYEKGFIDVDDYGNGYFRDIYESIQFLTSYKKIMGEDSINDPGCKEFVERKIKKFAKKYDNITDNNLDSIIDQL